MGQRAQFGKPWAGQWKGLVRMGGAALGAAVLLASASSGWAQSSGQRSGSGSSSATTIGPIGPNFDPLDAEPGYAEDPVRAQAEHRRIQALAAERQKAMVAETNRLVKLAAELNAIINSGQPSQLSADQERQLAEIEKLAHSIRDKMSMPVALPPLPRMEVPIIIPR